MTEEIQGIVKKTIFSSKDGRFCVFLIEEKESGKTVTVSLNSELPYIGQHVLLRGLVQAPPFWVAVQSAADASICPGEIRRNQKVSFFRRYSRNWSGYGR